jgi:hypothetical protein
MCACVCVIEMMNDAHALNASALTQVMLECLNAPPVLFRKSALRIKLAASQWSGRVTLPAVGGAGMLVDIPASNDDAASRCLRVRVCSVW